MYILHTYRDGQRDIYMLGASAKRNKKFREVSNSFFDTSDGGDELSIISPNVLDEQDLQYVEMFRQEYKIDRQVTTYAELMHLDDGIDTCDTQNDGTENITVSLLAFWVQNAQGYWIAIEPRTDEADTPKIVVGAVSTMQIKETLNGLEV